MAIMVSDAVQSPLLSPSQRDFGAKEICISSHQTSSAATTKDQAAWNPAAVLLETPHRS